MQARKVRSPRKATVSQSSPHPAPRRQKAATAGDQVTDIRHRLPADSIPQLGHRMGLSITKIAKFLNLPRSTLGRRIRERQLLSHGDSERVLGLLRLIGQVDVMVKESGDPTNFDAAKWLADWLEAPAPALGGHRPGEYMDTVEDQQLISQLLGQMRSGAYA